ncbi:MAG: helix-turn-helix transcriptional regulator [Sedimentitalea sp.]|uniref:helix-turn-helix domain-containing protein n=1 Tax=Sedimentitalea sp. TaxID=2048915 RepID=UPI003262DF57
MFAKSVPALIGFYQTVDFLGHLVDACSRTEMSMPSMSQIDVLLGKSIAKQRVARGISVENLARKIGLSASTVAAFEQGTRRASAKQLFEIADVLELKVQRLFNCPDNEPVEVRPTTAAFSGQGEEIAGHYDALSKSHRVAIFAFLLALKSDKEENHPFMQ